MEETGPSSSPDPPKVEETGPPSSPDPLKVEETGPLSSLDPPKVEEAGSSPPPCSDEPASEPAQVVVIHKIFTVMK
jgi:hypothetical protein